MGNTTTLPWRGRRLALRRHPRTFLELARTYGDVVRFTIGAQKVLLLSHPGHVEAVLDTHQARFRKGWGPQPGGVLGEGLIGSDGALHERHRRALAPLFHGSRLAGYAGALAASAGSMAESWRERQVVDVWAAMKELTSTFVCRALLGIGDEGRRALTRASALITRQFVTYMSAWAPLARALDPRRWRLAASLEEVDEVVYARIRERRASAAEGADLVSTLVRQGELDDREIRDEVLTFFVAGYETIALALTWSWFLLGGDPAARERLWAEIDRLEPGAPPGSRDLARLSFTRAVLTEAMRLFPPQWMIGRRATEAVDLGDLPVEAGTLVLVSPYVVHRSPSLFPDPERFRPERWLGDATPARRFAYLPFGAGPRRCIGEGLAWIEGTLALAILARRWSVEPLNRRVPRFDPRVTLRPRGGLPARLVPRPG